MTMERSFIRFWNKRWKGLEVGHRGAGPSFKPSTDDDAIRENTIASLRRAIDAGADMVGFFWKFDLFDLAFFFVRSILK